MGTLCVVGGGHAAGADARRSKYAGLLFLALRRINFGTATESLVAGTSFSCPSGVNGLAPGGGISFDSGLEEVMGRMLEDVLLCPFPDLRCFLLTARVCHFVCACVISIIIAWRSAARSLSPNLASESSESKKQHRMKHILSLLQVFPTLIPNIKANNYQTSMGNEVQGNSTTERKKSLEQEKERRR